MSVAYVAVTAVTMAANGGIAVADLARAEFVRANAAGVGMAPRWVPVVAIPKVAAVIGLLLGLLGWRLVGVAAAAGLVVFYALAVGAHIRARVFHNIAYPAGFLALAVGSLAVVVVEGL